MPLAEMSSVGTSFVTAAYGCQARAALREPQAARLLPSLPQYNTNNRNNDRDLNAM